MSNVSWGHETTLTLLTNSLPELGKSNQTKCIWRGHLREQKRRGTELFTKDGAADGL